MFKQECDVVMFAKYELECVTVKSVVLIMMLVFSAGLTGCTASDWIHAAGGVMQAQDAYDKKARGDRIKRANSAAARVRA